MKTAISVIMPSRNEGERLLRAARSLVDGRQDAFPLEIVVVDDASTDNSCEHLAKNIGKASNFSLVIHRLDRWSGIPFARNRGAEIAKYPVFVVTDANTQYPQNWDLPVWPNLHPGRILAGSIIDENTRECAHGLTLDFPSMGVQWLKSAESFGGYVPIAPCTCTVIDSHLFHELGGYDETLPLYGAAEPEFSVRAWLSGYEIANVPALSVAHRFRSQTDISQFQRQNYRVLLTNYVRFACSYLPDEMLKSVLEFYERVMDADFDSSMEELVGHGIWDRRALLMELLPLDFSWFASRFGLYGRVNQAPATGIKVRQPKLWKPAARVEDLARTLVIVPAFRLNHLTTALVQDCSRERVGVMVVDNSGDYQACGNECVLRPGTNLGWLRANNLAVETALQQGRWDRFVFLNNDLRLSTDFFAGLVWTETTSGASVVAASYDGHWKVQRPDAVRDGNHLPAARYRPEPVYIPFGACDGTCVSINRRVFERVGMLDNEHFGRFGWAAMTDLCFRARSVGMTTAVSRAAFANHLHGGRHTARIVVGADYEVLAEREGTLGMEKRWGPDWRDSRPVPTASPCLVYTTTTGGRDTLKDPLFVPPGWKFVCFTDSRRVRSRIWDVRPTVWASPDGDPRRTARWHKVNADLLFPEHDFSIWVDASVQATGDWRHLLWYLGSFGLASYRHYLRDCLYSEGLECIRLGLDDPTLIQEQLARYRSEGYPEHNGLFETTLLLRRHNESAMIEFARLWWDEISHGSKRDQISANYAAWRLNLRFGLVEDTLRSSSWLVRHR